MRKTPPRIAAFGIALAILSIGAGNILGSRQAVETPENTPFEAVQGVEVVQVTEPAPVQLADWERPERPVRAPKGLNC